MSAQPISPIPRVALTRSEAAQALGVSLSHFERHVQHELRMIRSGSVRLVPVAELLAWAERAATLAVGDTLSSATKRRGGA
jgi:excisionase family DNA binding protein